MTWNIRKLTLYAAVAVLLFLVGSQFFAEKRKAEVEGESTAFAERVISLCQTSDPAVAQRLIEAGVCENAHRVATPGAQGLQGEKGEPGRDGKSIVGPKGEKGDPGQIGPDGQTVVGPAGESIAGPKGEKGDPGQDGADGQSITGPKGDRGEPGEPGADGRTPSQMTCVRADPLGDEYTCTVTAYE